MDFLSKLLPTIVGVLGSPLAGLAVEVVGSALGMSEPSKDKITKTLTSGQLSGEQIAALKQAEMALVVRLKELDIKVEELKIRAQESDAQDRTSARGLFEKGFRLIGALSILTVVGFFASIYWVFTGGLSFMSSEQTILAGTVIGYLAANVQQVYNYFFGSSNGSDKKNEMMNAIMKQNANVPNTERT